MLKIATSGPWFAAWRCDGLLAPLIAQGSSAVRVPGNQHGRGQLALPSADVRRVAGK